MSKAQRIAANAVIAALMERPGDFTADEYALVDRKTGLEFWIANTRFDGGIYRPLKLEFGMWHSMRFHRAVAVWKAYQAALLLRAQ